MPPHNNEAQSVLESICVMSMPPLCRNFTPLATEILCDKFWS